MYSIFIYACMHACMHVFICLFIHLFFIYVCMHAFIYLFIYMYYLLIYIYFIFGGGGLISSHLYSLTFRGGGISSHYCTDIIHVCIVCLLLQQWELRLNVLMYTSIKYPFLVRMLHWNVLTYMTTKQGTTHSSDGNMEMQRIWRVVPAQLVTCRFLKNLNTNYPLMEYLMEG